MYEREEETKRDDRKEKQKKKRWKIVYSDTSSVAYDKICQTPFISFQNTNKRISDRIKMTLLISILGRSKNLLVKAFEKIIQ